MAAAEVTMPAAEEQPKQVGLPQLPLPGLSESLAAYLASVQPLLSEEEYAAEAEVAKPDSPELQEAHAMAVKLHEESGKVGKSYFEDIWREAYLRPRGGLAVHVNPFFVLEVRG